MKLFEVMYPKCKKCGYDFSKGGRDHRVGVCDVCAFPNKKKKKVKEGIQVDNLTIQVRDLLWQAYQQDPFLPAEVEYPAEMDDEEYLEFEDHVKDVMRFAKQHRIQNPEKAIQMYSDEGDKHFRQEVSKMRH